MVAIIAEALVTVAWKILSANDFAIPRAIISYATGSA